jgi:hypothetical protein
MNCFELILECAKIPSFSSFEDRSFPFIKKILNDIPNVTVNLIPDNNLLIKVPGKRKGPIIAFSAHLDKICHDGLENINTLSTDSNESELLGQLDDSVGLGICLFIIQESQNRNFPPLYFLFSEMEESYGLKNHPHKLRNNGVGLHPQIGAERIAKYLLENLEKPAIVITLDSTPLFKGSNGIALYSKHWDRNGLIPSENLITKTKQLEDYFSQLYPQLFLSNNKNDYLTYGRILNSDDTVPCIALEPAIYPYHTVGEKVFCKDIHKTVEIIMEFLQSDFINNEV